MYMYAIIEANHQVLLRTYIYMWYCTYSVFYNVVVSDSQISWF